MLGMKKKKDKDKEVEQKKDDLPEFEETKIQEIRMMLKRDSDLLKFAVDEFKRLYAGSFDTENTEINAENTSLDLLFAIYAEQRLIREILTHQQ